MLSCTVRNSCPNLTLHFFQKKMDINLLGEAEPEINQKKYSSGY
jgi:hypothetical protein